MNAYFNEYKNNAILTASREQILIMLYDGAIRFVRQARIGIEDKRLDVKSNGITRAMAIISEFNNTLDHKIGGEIAANLSRLYDFMNRELIAVNASNDAKRLDSVEKILLDLRGAFAEAMKINARQGQQGASAVNGSIAAAL